MGEDAEGFVSPALDRGLCINCLRCQAHCPIVQDVQHGGAIATYGLIHIDSNIVADSASGGAFTAIAQIVLSQGGVVYGCAFNEQLVPVVVSAESTDDLHALRGSKYVQCRTDRQYEKMRDSLEQGRGVLYCATPCQIAGLKAYLRKPYQNLVLIDLFCKGVPSPGLFKKYLDWLATTHGGTIEKYRFRDKQHGWRSLGSFCVNGQEHTLNGTDPFYYAFLMNRTYRRVCYRCKFASHKRPGDLSIGDFWGVELCHPDVSTTQGVSAVLVSTAKGVECINAMGNNARIFPTTFANIARGNVNLLHPSGRCSKRDAIYARIATWPFERLVYWYFYHEPVIITRVKACMPRPLKRLLRMILQSRLPFGFSRGGQRP